MTTSVEISQADIEKVKALLGELSGCYKKVMVTSINKTLTTAKTQVTARIANKVNLKSSRIKEDFKIDKANYGKISGSLSALDATENRIGLIQYAAKQTAKGVTVQVLRSNSRALLKHAFIAHGKKSTKEHVFWRKNRPNGTGKWPKGKKLKMFWGNVDEKFKKPLSRRVGPSAAYWFGKPDVFDPVAIQAQHVYSQNVESRIDEILRRHNG
jgi:hypothetical protein